MLVVLMVLVIVCRMSYVVCRRRRRHRRRRRPSPRRCRCRHRRRRRHRGRRRCVFVVGIYRVLIYFYRILFVLGIYLFIGFYYISIGFYYIFIFGCPRHRFDQSITNLKIYPLHQNIPKTKKPLSFEK